LTGPRDDPSEPHRKPPDECVSARAEIGIGEILDRARHAGFGFIAALVALVSIRLVGLTVPFGLAAAAVSVQIIAYPSRGYWGLSVVGASPLRRLSR